MRKLVTIQKIDDIKPIDGADFIELARVKGWNVVVKKGEYKVDDMVLYYEIDSFLPIKPEYEFLLKGSKAKKMLVDGKEIEGILLKTKKLKGIVSQGLVMPLSLLNHIVDLNYYNIGDDVSGVLGVVLYEMPIPAELQGKFKGNFPSFLPKTDEIRAQNMPDIFNSFYISEKLDGCSVSYFKKDNVFGVCSRNLELENNGQTQWKIADKLNLQEVLPDNMAIQGELIGDGIQGNPLKIKGQELSVYNVYNIATGKYLDYKDFIEFCREKNLLTVPIIDEDFKLPNSLDEILKMADGKSLINKNEDREGIVVRPKIEAKYNGDRLSFKVISNNYLLKNE
jgi:RNA ligase (TIGR02306 family)